MRTEHNSTVAGSHKRNLFGVHSIENDYNMFAAMKNIESKMIGDIFEAFLWSNQMKWWDWRNRGDIEMKIQPTTTYCLQWIEWK